MALPSQLGRPLARSSNVYRRRRRRGGRSWLIVFAVLVGGVTWLAWPKGDTAQPSPPPTLVEATGDELEQPVFVPPPAPGPAPVDPVVTPIVELTPSVIEKPAPQPIPTPEPTVIAKAEVEEPVIEDSPFAAPPPAVVPMPRSTFLEVALAMVDAGDFHSAQRSLTDALREDTLNDEEQAQARGMLSDLADRLVFSSTVVLGDPYSLEYIVRSGDTLSGIVRKMGLQVDWRLIQRINHIPRANAIQAGQTLKLLTGPFHAVVDKTDYRIDIYMGEGEDQVFVRSFPVGLGEFNSTPTGLFKVRPSSKLINPTWVNPRTRQHFPADDPKNPIGERWIGLMGVEERTRDLAGMGIHGTIDPASIGRDASMGCVRLRAESVAQLYELLTEGVSTVEIR